MQKVEKTYVGIGRFKTNAPIEDHSLLPEYKYKWEVSVKPVSINVQLISPFQINTDNNLT